MTLSRTRNSKIKTPTFLQSFRRTNDDRSRGNRLEDGNRDDRDRFRGNISDRDRPREDRDRLRDRIRDDRLDDRRRRRLEEERRREQLNRLDDDDYDDQGGDDRAGRHECSSMCDLLIFDIYQERLEYTI